MRRAIVVGTAALIAATSGCGQGHAGDGGPALERSYEVGPFQRIEVAGSYQVDVHTGSARSVSASGPRNAIDTLVVEVKGDRLLIHPRDHGFFSSGGWHGPVTVRVTAPGLAGAAIAGSGDFQVDKVGGESFQGSVDGSGNISVAAIDVQSLKLSIGGSGNVRIASGQARQAEYDIAGSGGIDTQGVRSETANISIAGSGGVRGQATDTANIKIMGSGDVTLTGGARCAVSKAGSGHARCS